MPTPALACLAAGRLLALAAAAEPLPTDPRLVTGTLDNGLSYVVMHHATPPGRVALWMHVDSGSLNETDKQRGLAHFLEHMAFNGSANFKPGAVVPFFESLGMTFGRDQNAFTNMEQTTYQLSLPDNKPQTLAKGLLFFGDVNARLLLTPEEIESERGVIQGEKNSSKSAQQRAGEFMLEHVAPGSRYSQRNTIGTEESIRTVQRQDFLDYYTTWYGPANTTMIVVGDMDPAVMVAQIKKEFNQPGPAKPRPADLDGGVKPYPAHRAVLFSDPELTRASVSITRLLPVLPPTTTVEQWRHEWVGALARSAFNRRMSDKVSTGKVAFQTAFASVGQSANALRSAAVGASGEKDKWETMLREAAAELQRARAFGFSDREIDDARKAALSSFETAAEQESTLPARAFLARINGAVAAGEPVMSAAQELDLARRILPGITPSECSAWFASTFNPDAVMFSASLPSMPNLPSEADLLRIGADALKAETSREADAARADALMKDLPTPGTVVEQAVHEPSGVWSAWLSNGVRAHHRFMDYRANEVSISITLLGGELFETAKDRGITSAAMIPLSGGGGGPGGRGGRGGGGGGGGAHATAHLSSTDIRSLMTGKKVRVSGRAGSDAIQLSVSGTPEDIETGLQLAFLLLTEPRIEPVAFDNWKTRTLDALDSLDKTPMQLFGKLQAEARYPDDDVRTKPPSRANIESITRDAAQARLDSLLATSPIEVAIVGDLPRERAVQLLTRYLGSLPKRDRVKTGMLANLRQMTLPKGPRIRHVEMDTVTELGGAFGGFYGPDQSNVDDVRAMRLATSIITTRMVKRIREEEQLVYSIRANLDPGAAYPGFGMLFAAAPSGPATVDALSERIGQMFAEFATSGCSDDEVAKAKLQMATTLDEQMKEPAAWLARLENLTYDGLSLDDFMRSPDAYQHITTDQINATYRKYYAPDRTVSVKIKPKTAPADKH